MAVAAAVLAGALCMLCCLQCGNGYMQVLRAYWTINISHRPWALQLEEAARIVEVQSPPMSGSQAMPAFMTLLAGLASVRNRRVRALTQG